MRLAKASGWLSVILLIGCALVAAAAMFTNLSYGLPLHYHPDEAGKLYSISAIVEGAGKSDFRHPHFMLFFSLPFIYVGKMLGADTLLSARAAVATLGVATVCLLFVIGRYLAGPLAGLASALVFATAPLAVVAAHDFKEDIPLAFWLTLQTFFLLRYLRNERACDLFFAAAAFGVSVGTKYTGLLSLPLVVGAVLFQRKPGWAEQTGMAMAAAAGGFLLATPDILWHPLLFLEGVGYELRHAVAGHLDPLHDTDAWDKRLRISPVAYLWTYHLRHSLIPGLSVPGLLLTLVGAFLVMKKDGRVWWLACAGLLLYYFVIETLPLKSPPFAARYMVAVLPFAALLAGGGLSLGCRDRAWLRGLVCLLFAGTLVLNGYSSSRQVWAMRPETRDEAREWVLSHVPYGALLTIPGFYAYSPFGDLSAPATQAKPPYEFLRVGRSPEEDIRRATSDPKSYVIVSSFSYQRYLDQPELNPDMHRFYRVLFEQHAPLARFEAPFVPLGFHNPTIIIYRPAGGPQK